MKPRILYGWAAELALIALTVVVTIGMERLFLDRSFLRDALALAIASHLVALAGRRAGLGMASSGLLSVVAAVVTLTVLLYSDTANIVLPTGETLDLVRDDLSEGWRIFSEESAPVPVVPGFVLATGALLWVSAFLADWAAFRLRSPIEAIAPASSVFVFTALLGSDQNQVRHAAVFAAAVIGTWLTIRVNRQVREEVWIESVAGQGPRAALRLGSAAGAVAVLAGIVAGPLLPGAGDPGLVDLTELDNGPQTRTVISPLVEVQAKIVEQAQFEIFSVDVEEGDRDYWRLMSLDEFDGQIWRASSNFDEADGVVESRLDPSLPTRTVRQTFTTSRLGNIYLPVAFELAEVIDSGDMALEYEAESATLVVTRESYLASQEGFSYTVESSVPVKDGPQLRQSTTANIDSGLLDHYTRLPRDFPDSVTAEAQRVTANATTDYDRAVALQDHLRQNFTYNIAVALEHDVTGLESFLFDVREGYCEQFASAFAAMARSIGLPTRLAVGFTWGDWSPSRGEYIVRGEHAHAWPEVFFEGTGWVNFEPTPGRGGPNDASVTGHVPNQAGSEPVTPTTSTPAPGQQPSAGPTNSAPGLVDEGPVATPTTVPDAGPGFPFAKVGLVMLAGAVVVALIPTLRLMQRRTRSARVSHDPRGRVELAWDETLEALDLVDLRHRPQETPLEFADRVRGRRGDFADMQGLAESTTCARYSPVIDDSVVRTAESSADEIRSICRRTASNRRRALGLFDPRPLVGR